MRKWGCAVLAVVLAGCGQENAGGGGIEIPNGLGVTVTVSGAARKGVMVRALARESWTTRISSNRSVVVDSAYTDSLGHATLHCPSGEGCWIEALSGAMGARVEQDAGKGSVSLALASLSSLKGNLGNGPISGVEIHLGGSDRVVRTDAAGSFRFDSLPQSSSTWKWNLVARPKATGRLALLAAVARTSHSVSVQGLADDTESVLLEDFSSEDIGWNLQDLFGHCYWWISTNGADLDVFGVANPPSSAIRNDGTFHYISLPVNLSGVSNPWANTGLNLGSDTGFLPELSAFKDVRLKVRGTGTWTFHAVERVSSDSTRDWIADFSMDTSWTTVRIAATALSCGNLKWAASSRRVGEIVFQTNGNGKLEIAEVALEGASLSDWSK